MSGHVFANGMEISSKASGNKSIAAMPDVCMSPPSPPAGPIPIPYPNTATTSDTTDGSKSVQIKGKEVHLKNKSSYKKSHGNQPATNNFGANIITHRITGAMKFAAWSFNVKVEGQNVVRFMDLTTHNHANSGGGALTSSVAEMAAAQNAGNLEDVCTALAAANTNVRTQKVLTPKNTVAHALFTAPNGVTRVLKAVSSGAKVKYDNSFCTGLPRVGLGKKGREERFKKGVCLTMAKWCPRCAASLMYTSQGQAISGTHAATRNQESLKQYPQYKYTPTTIPAERQGLFCRLTGPIANPKARRNGIPVVNVKGSCVRLPSAWIFKSASRKRRSRQENPSVKMKARAVPEESWRIECALRLVISPKPRLRQTWSASSGTNGTAGSTTNSWMMRCSDGWII